MALKYIRKRQEYIALSTDDKSKITTAGSIVYYTDLKTREVYNNGSWTEYVVNTSDIIDTTGNYTDFTFHDAVGVAGDGTAMTVNPAHKTLVVEIDSTVTSHTVAFKAKGASATYTAITGVKLDTLTIGTSTTGLTELWQFDITGLTTVLMDITALVVGTGTTTIKGRAVS